MASTAGGERVFDELDLQLTVTPASPGTRLETVCHLTVRQGEQTYKLGFLMSVRFAQERIVADVPGFVFMAAALRDLVGRERVLRVSAIGSSEVEVIGLPDWLSCEQHAAGDGGVASGFTSRSRHKPPSYNAQSILHCPESLGRTSRSSFIALRRARLSHEASQRTGSTLPELLVVIGILGVLLALIAPAVLAACATQAIALNAPITSIRSVWLFSSTTPNMGSFRLGAATRMSGPPAAHGLDRESLPYLEREGIWREALQAFEQEKSFRYNPPHVHLGTVLRGFTCPSDGRIHTSKEFGLFSVAFTSYLGLEGMNQFTKDGVLFLDSRIRMADLIDGTSNTLMVGERPPTANLVLGWWYAGWGQDKDGSGEMILGVREHNVGTWYTNTCPSGPYDFQRGHMEDPCSAFHFWSLHPGGSHFLFADGGVRFLKYSANPLMPALATRAGREAVELPE